jgi:hypothetical protein
MTRIIRHSIAAAALAVVLLGVGASASSVLAQSLPPGAATALANRTEAPLSELDLARIEQRHVGVIERNEIPAYTASRIIFAH